MFTFLSPTYSLYFLLDGHSTVHSTFANFPLVYINYVIDRNVLQDHIFNNMCRICTVKLYSSITFYEPNKNFTFLNFDCSVFNADQLHKVKLFLHNFNTSVRSRFFYTRNTNEVSSLRVQP